MSKVAGGGSSKGGSAKSTSKSSSASVTKSRALQTASISEHLIRLRAALHDESGVGDRDCLADFAAFGKYDRNGLDLELRFFTGR